MPATGAPDAGAPNDAGAPAAGGGGDSGSAAAGPDGSVAAGSGETGTTPSEPSDTGVGPVEDLSLAPHPNRLRAHTWVLLHMRAAESALPIAEYEVRVATEPITDETSFLRMGREAKDATDSSEGATRLMLPVDVPAGEPIDAAIGDLIASTHYWVGVRATDEANRHGPIRVAEITTSTRQFATVSPCFVATVAYGSPLAQQVSVLRRLRDRYLMPQALGRPLVAAYYRIGGKLAAWIAPHSSLRAAARALLAPLVALARHLR
jgi:hypothetical protein